MLFNSLDFAFFLPIVFFLYWFVAGKSLKLQNIIIVASGFVFYGWWDWRFLGLMVLSASIDYVSALLIEKTESKAKRKFYLSWSLIANLGILGFFKYYNFFAENFVSAFSLFGYHVPPSTLNVILPLGISFYTFHAMSYTIDVYHQKIKATHNIIHYYAFISFFPQLVAGPIARATHLLPQFYVKREFNYTKAVDGLRQILWGFFKKMVIADGCGNYANMIFGHQSHYGGSTLVVGAVFFAFQLYCDFSGYSDIALGTARLFGFELRRNFAYPFFSRDTAELWRRWHISLSTWFRDYLYIPIGGSQGSTFNKVRNVMIVFIVSGFWHGAKWNFIVWGALNGLFILPLVLTKRNRNNLEIVAQGKILPSFRDVFNMGLTFALFVFSFIFFRAETMPDAFHYIKGIFSGSLFSMPEIKPLTLFALIIFCFGIEWLGREKEYALASFGFKWHRLVRLSFYYFVIVLIFFFTGKQQSFIYFQF